MSRAEIEALIRAVAALDDADLGTVAGEAARPEITTQMLRVARDNLRKVAKMLDGEARPW